MRNKFIISAMLLVFAASALWAQFWKDYSEKDRQTLAQAYWLAGKQYQAVGKEDKGKEFQQLARTIDPQLDPSAISDQAMPSAAELLARGNASAIGAGSAEMPVQSLNSFFLRFLGALLDKDSTAASGFLDGSIYLSKVPTEMTREDARPTLDQFFSSAPLGGKTPSDLYDLGSIVISRVSPAMQQAWGNAYTMSVSANADYSQYLSFWEPKQQFFVHRVAGDWYIFAIGQNPPPLSWKPKTAAPVASAPPAAAATDAEASKAVTDAFTTCLGALLKKDADGALAVMSDNIRFLRLRQTVTKEELKTSLEGSFENADFGAADVGEAVDLDSLFVERAESPGADVSGTVYSLSVRSKTDLSKALPFWTDFQRYYFVNDNGAWKIFALM
ncbi:MAG: hypothetical protein ABSG17_14800 [Spirochaetia bacterium]|jgi:hypothetical protein